MFAETFLEALAAGLFLGCIYGLMCVGLGLIFGVMRVINFAQGDFLMLGMYFTLYVVSVWGLLAFLGPAAAPFVGAVLAGPALFVGGYLLHRLLIARVSGTSVTGSEDEGRSAQLILTLGVALALENGALILFGSTPQSARTTLALRAWEIPLLYDPTAAVFINKASVVACVLSIVIAAALYLLINRSRLGKTLRAAADNPTAAIYMGIDVDRAHRIAFGIGTGVTAVAGGLVATYHPFQPYVGLDYVIIMYAGVVMGGMGSILGAFWGGLTIGLVQQLSTLVLPTQLQNAAIFAVFLLVVLMRPQGLFGRAAERI
ncbi:MAG TPA: branched-chain amino acid ABC transporter permease [Alphaproteobacteria bacterium]|nr:branched-chain amino acid ABC transporter permease [Alphaproteobacteria bacterium]